MRVRSGARWLVVLALLLAVAPASTHASDPEAPADSGSERPSTVVVSVRDGGFHWVDAGVGAAAALATTLLVLGLGLVLRPNRGAIGDP